MHLVPFTGCCAGEVIYKLDEEWARQHHETVPLVGEAEIEKALIELLAAVGSTTTFVMVTTNNNQKLAAIVLERNKFKAIAKVPSKHPELEITIWLRNQREANE